MLATNEKELVTRLLTLVNLKTITDAGQVEKLAASIPGFTERVMSYAGDVNQPRALQAALRKALDGIISNDQTELDAVIKAANQNLRHVQTTVQLTSDGDLLFAAGLLGCDAIFWYGVALILDRRRELRDRLARCGAPGCGRYVLSFARGRPQRHCSEEHRRAADKIQSVKRSQNKRDKEKADDLLAEGKSFDFVCGYLKGRLDKQTVERIAERVKTRTTAKMKKRT
jgi:hypothetical protein